nr:MmgE/PrpD family protein [Pseudonocardia dioxanivorans]
MTISGRLAELVVGTEPAALPEATRTATSMHTLDTLGCALAALGLDAVPYVRASYAERGVSGPASVVGQAGGLPADMAAMVNGALAHALDYDDTHAGSIVHVSAATVPAALAMGEHTGRSGAEVLTAIALGNEVSVRLGRPAGAALHARGFHPTGVCGVFGATATAARLAGADAEQTRNAFGIAGSMAGGLMEFLADGSETKPFHPGWAAHAAINAVWFALHGATGPATVVEGDRGFFGAYLRGEEPDLSSVTDGLGERWLTDEIAFKPYPACHYVHAPLDALSAILDEEHLGAGDIAEITAFTDETGVILVLEPAADKAAPRTAYDAKFSIPYAFGARVAHGAVGVETFTDQAIGDPRRAGRRGEGALRAAPLLRHRRLVRRRCPRRHHRREGVRERAAPPARRRREPAHRRRRGRQVHLERRGRPAVRRGRAARRVRTRDVRRTRPRTARRPASGDRQGRWRAQLARRRPAPPRAR